ncbi:MAG TPA: methionyl-tRNA formyltransferase [Chlamydiales bacterium]|nr:methionyl-tRNA formyltransferase [Chlamydiales bacterium]
MRIVFFGTPHFAASILDFLLQSGVVPIAIVTQPDRPKGRSLTLSPSPVKELILTKEPKCSLYQPEKCSDSQFLDAMKCLKPDLFVVVAFGQILPQKLLDIPQKGAINIHASLLPKYRGAAPIQRALMEGERETGVAIQKMVKQLDAGDVIAVAKIEIAPNMNAGELQEILCELAKPLLLLVLKSYSDGIPPGEMQDPTLVTFAPKISVEEGEIHWDFPAEKIHNLVRAFSPRPGAWSWVYDGSEKKRVKIFETEVVDQSGLPGKFFPSQPIVGCGEKSLRIKKIQTEGKKILPGDLWLRGFSSLPKFV